MLSLGGVSDEREEFLPTVGDEISTMGIIGFGMGSDLNSWRGNDGRARSDVMGDTNGDGDDAFTGGAVGS